MREAVEQPLAWQRDPSGLPTVTVDLPAEAVAAIHLPG